MAILNRSFESDEQGNIRVRTTCSAEGALEMARLSRETNETGYFGDKNGECRLMGYIPEEMWVFDPWLMSATKARREGDMAKYNYYIQKFFDVHSIFRGNKKTRYWRGSRAVLL